MACIEDQDIIPDKAGQALDRILAHLRKKEQEAPARPILVPPTRAPPVTLSLFAGKDSAFTEFNQQGRQRVVTAEKTAWHGFLRTPVRQWPE